jgi:Ca2+-transporting ATPase
VGLQVINGNADCSPSSRRLDNKFNIFEGIQRNWFFIGINMIMIGGQIMIIFVGGRAFSVTRLNGAQWAYSIILGATSMPVAVIIRLIPDELFKKVLPERMKRKRTPQVVISDEDERFEWNQGLEEIREELTFLKRIRGGRLNAIKFKLQHPREFVHPRSRAGSSRSRSSSVLPQTPNGDSSGHNHAEAGFPTPPSPGDNRSRRRGRSRSNSAFGPAAAMAGVIAGSIGGWSPIERPGGEGHPGQPTEPQGARAELSAQEGVEVNPATSPNDPVLIDPKPSVDHPPSQVPATNPTLQSSTDDVASHPVAKEKE